MQTVLITGSNRGLGYEFTRQYLAQDARVIATCRQTESGNQLHLLEKKYSKKLTIISLDVTQENSIKEAFNLVQKNFSHLDLLVNNAGIGLRKSFKEEMWS
ncbi:MAG: SDR family NAD(P)-dependent oxidoreductase [Prochloraceae cyanobacterium]|nr:SDR family NAD(P)-dependent oxidoreductase [Prochloraceae cyanobacterium]